LFAMAMPRGSGKALALDTPLATPSGWTTMGDVKVGDTLFDEQGRSTPITGRPLCMHDCPYPWVIRAACRSLVVMIKPIACLLIT
jgi:replicative DNA helicase